MKQGLLSPGSFPLQDEYTAQLVRCGHGSLICYVSKWQGALTCCLLPLLCFLLTCCLLTCFPLTCCLLFTDLLPAVAAVLPAAVLPAAVLPAAVLPAAVLPACRCSGPSDTLSYQAQLTPCCQQHDW
jgi:hypothetical protein